MASTLNCSPIPRRSHNTSKQDEKRTALARRDVFRHPSGIGFVHVSKPVENIPRAPKSDTSSVFIKNT